MSTSAPDPATFARNGLRRHALMVAAGAGGAATLGLLAAGSLVPLVGAIATGTLSATIVATWLGGLGSNALASWLDTWARQHLGQALGDDPAAEQKLFVDLARDLQAQLESNQALATDVGTLLQQVDAIPVALDALAAQGVDQTRLMRLLLEDLQQTTFRNERLHDVTLRAVETQGERVRADAAQRDAAQLAAIQNVLDEVQRLRQLAPSSVSTTIDGNVDTFQQITMSGGRIEKVVGKELNIIIPQPHRAPVFSVPLAFVKPSQPTVGRESLLQTLRERLSATQSVRLGLHGMAGVGKSRLAVELAYDTELRERFPSGILATTLGPLPHVESTIVAWCGALGIPHEPAKPVVEQIQQIAQYIQRIDKQCLWIIDDVWTTDVARLFIPTSDKISVVFTSRQLDTLQRLGTQLFSSDSLISVPPLEPQYATTLLQQSAGHTDGANADELITLAALVGGLPLYLTLMGNELRLRGEGNTDWFAQTVEDLRSSAKRLALSVEPIDIAWRNLRGSFLDRLRKRPPQQVTPRMIFDMSIAPLTRDERRALVRLTALPPTPLSFDALSAAVVTEANNKPLDV